MHAKPAPPGGVPHAIKGSASFQTFRTGWLNGAPWRKDGDRLIQDKNSMLDGQPG